MATAPGTNTNPSAGGASATLNSVSDTAHELVDKIGGPADQAASKIRQVGHSAVDKAVDAAAPAAQWIEQKQAYVQDQLKSTTDYVTANPLKAIAIAFVAGVVFGRITS